MASFDALCELLPSLYRPEPNDEDILTTYLTAVARELEEVEASSAAMQQGHWFRYADTALHSRFVNRTRNLQNLPPLLQRNAADRAFIESFPYIRDLARLGALLPVSPWLDPPSARESVEQYRDRILRTVRLYREGTGTRAAVRRMVEVQLPVLRDGGGDRPFWVEEFAPSPKERLAVQQEGEQPDMVGPMMRWIVSNPALLATPVTVYVQGVTPEAGRIDATDNPLVELFQPADGSASQGIAYRRTLAPDVTLRLQPAFSSWLGSENGVLRARTFADATHTADPTAPGPWDVVDGTPTDSVAAVRQTLDRMLWVATNNAGVGKLSRYDGSKWNDVASGLAQLNCLAANGRELLVGASDGLQSVALFPEVDGNYKLAEFTAVKGLVVHCIAATSLGLLIGTHKGVFRRTSLDAFEKFAFGHEVFAITEDRHHRLHFGTEVGLFLHDPEMNSWFRFVGGSASDQIPDWQPVNDAVARGGSESADPPAFLPEVTALLRGPDTSLWIGTTRGIARYTAFSVGGFTYTTSLQAFPELAGSVFSIEEDERGIVWFGTDRGLFRYDGRDFWQFNARTQDDAAWVHLGRADSDEGENATPPQFRFNPVTETWQRFTTRTRTFENVSTAFESVASPAVHCVAWTDDVTAHIGVWDGQKFTVKETVPDEDLDVRIKPALTRVVTGGLRALPRVPAGESVWRYLELETTALNPPRLPFFTREGRLIPPPDDATAVPGRFDGTTPPPPSDYDGAVFVYNPAARVWMEWEPRRPLSLLVRLKKRSTDEHIDPIVLDRVRTGVDQVRPAGVRSVLAVEDEIVKGNNNGNNA